MLRHPRLSLKKAETLSKGQARMGNDNVLSRYMPKQLVLKRVKYDFHIVQMSASWGLHVSTMIVVFVL